MKFLSERYSSVNNHQGFDICCLKRAILKDRDYMGFVIDHKFFSEKKYEHPDNAIRDIDKAIHDHEIQTNFHKIVKSMQE